MATTADTADTAGQVVHVDPRILLLERNVRADADADPNLVASVADLGVLQPITAVRTSDGGVRVRFGQRRTLAAIAAGRASVPVLVVADEATDTAAEVERLVTQYAENTHRAGLSVKDQVQVMAQLAAFGVPAGQIAKRTQAKRAEVETALSVAGSRLATDTLARYPLTVDQAAVVAEFEDDPEIVQALVVAAQRGGFAHTAQRARDERAETARCQEVAEGLRREGVLVLEPPDSQSLVQRLHHLADTEGNPLTDQAHATCPGHAAYVDSVYGWRPTTDEQADEPVDEPGGEDQDEEEDRPTGSQQQWSAAMVPVYVCTDPTVHGHRPRWGYSTTTPRAKVADLPAAEAEAARAERRDVIESNKAWRSAETVRREWLRTLLARRTAPKGTAALVATALARDGEVITRINANHLAADLLGLETSSGYGRSPALADAAQGTSEARAQVLALAQVLAGYEAATDVNSWRWVDPGTTRYLRFIAAGGYDLSAVERRACGEQVDPDPSDREPASAEEGSDLHTQYEDGATDQDG